MSPPDALTFWCIAPWRSCRGCGRCRVMRSSSCNNRIRPKWEINPARFPGAPHRHEKPHGEIKPLAHSVAEARLGGSGITESKWFVPPTISRRCSSPRLVSSSGCRGGGAISDTAVVGGTAQPSSGGHRRHDDRRSVTRRQQSGHPGAVHAGACAGPIGIRKRRRRRHLRQVRHECRQDAADCSQSRSRGENCASCGYAAGQAPVIARPSPTNCAPLWR